MPINIKSSIILDACQAFKAKESAMDKDPNTEKKKAVSLSSAKREDIWALIIAGVVMLTSFAAPDGMYRFFMEVLFLF